MDATGLDCTPEPLTGSQRKYLRGLANPRKALVQVGEGGVSESLIGAVDKALHDHELVKVRLVRPADKKSTAQELAERSQSHLCGLVEHTVILYRPHPQEPKIEVPG